MKKMRIASFVILIASLIAILYALAFSPADWIVYTIAIVGIEERTKEPFIGY